MRHGDGGAATRTGGDRSDVEGSGQDAIPATLRTLAGMTYRVTERRLRHRERLAVQKVVTGAAVGSAAQADALTGRESVTTVGAKRRAGGLRAYAGSPAPGRPPAWALRLARAGRRRSRAHQTDRGEARRSRPPVCLVLTARIPSASVPDVGCAKRGGVPSSRQPEGAGDGLGDVEPALSVAVIFSPATDRPALARGCDRRGVVAAAASDRGADPRAAVADPPAAPYPGARPSAWARSMSIACFPAERRLSRGRRQQVLREHRQHGAARLVAEGQPNRPCSGRQP